MDKDEKKPKVKKEKVKKEKVKKEKVKKAKVKKAKGKKEAAKKNDADFFEGYEETASVKAKPIPKRKAMLLAFASLTGAFMCVCAGALLGTMLLKPVDNEVSAQVTQLSYSSASSGTTQYVQGNLDAENDGQVPQMALQDYTIRDSTSVASNEEENSFITGPTDFFANPSDYPAVSAEEVDNTIQQARNSNTVQTNNANSSAARKPNQSATVKRTGSKAASSSGAKESSGHLKSYVNTFEQSARILSGVSSETDVYELGKMYVSVNNSATELFDYAAQGQANGLSDEEIQKTYELSAAYSILADGLHYAATVLENGELFDAELMKMTNESAREKFDSSFGGSALP